MIRAERHSPALDGVRGLAILCVFAYHATTWRAMALKPFLGWGWMGVDLFFVLSGFLITGGLLDRQHEDAYYRPFYLRRALRIFPAFFFLMAIMLVSGDRLGFTASESRQLVEQQGWYWAYLLNFLIVIRGWDAVPLFLTHGWSLSIEEQFYLVWPPVVRRSTPHRVAMWALIIVAGSAALRAFLILRRVDPGVTYALTLTRADGLAWGAFLAAIVRSRDWLPRWQRARLMVLAVGAVALLAAVVRSHSESPWTRPMQLIGLSGIAAIAAVLVSVAFEKEPAILKFFALRACGRYSYGLYLWHLPVIIAVIRLTRLNGWQFLCAVTLLSAGCTAVSWLLIERPALSLKRYIRPGSRVTTWSASANSPP